MRPALATKKKKTRGWTGQLYYRSVSPYVDFLDLLLALSGVNFDRRIPLSHGQVSIEQRRISMRQVFMPHPFSRLVQPVL